MRLRQRIKNWLKARQISYRRWRHAFDVPELLGALRQAGVHEGDTLLVHSSWDAFAAFAGKPTDVIKALRSAIGDAGTLLMPTIPFRGTAVDFASSGAVFDVRRTPSQVGLLPELFRRMPGVVRSMHPTHSVAAVGPLATRLTEGHEASDTPCGPDTPYGRLGLVHGKNVFLGVPIDAMTYFHAVEAVLEPTMPFSPFTADRFAFRCKDHQGDEVDVRCRLFDPVVSRRRDIRKMEPLLRERGVWGEALVGDLRIIVLPAADIMSVATEMSRRGEFCYGE